MPQFTQLVRAIERLAPWELAEGWDRVGVQVHRCEPSIRRVMVALDLNAQVIREGQFHQVDGFILHHPFLFQPLTHINPTDPQGKILAQLLKNDQFVIAAHTNMDKAEYGINRYLAEMLGLTELHVIDPVRLQGYKVVVFTPPTHLDVLREKMAETGAGEVGEYRDCAFSCDGTGTFRPGDMAQPFLGRPGQFEAVAEARLEMAVSQSLLSRVLKTIQENHPYQEPVVDIYPLQNASRHGLGRVGVLPESLVLSRIWELVKHRLRVEHLKTSGEPDRMITRIAVCSGSGGSLIQAAVRAGADLYLTGELNYHQHWEAKEAGLAVIEAGHGATECCFVPLLGEHLEQEFEGENLQIIRFGAIEEPYRII